MKNQKKIAKKLLRELLEIVDKIGTFEEKFASEINSAHPKYRESVRNLIHYMALRNFDIRKIQKQLATLGLSSLGRSEAYVLATLYAVIRQLSLIAEEAIPQEKLPFIQFIESEEIASKNNRQIIGTIQRLRRTGIMVTMSPEAANDYDLVREMISAGMDVARINCAHDSPTEWQKMINNIRNASREFQISCKIVMDLGGPKIRTGPMVPGPKVHKIKPQKDNRGIAKEPVTVIFIKEGSIESRKDNEVPVKNWWRRKIKPDDEIKLKETSGKTRILKVLDIQADRLVTSAVTSCYFETGNKLVLYQKKKKVAQARVGELPESESFINLIKGDILRINKASKPGKGMVFSKDKKIKSHARISCTIPEIIDDTKVGERVLLNDGKIQGIIEEKKKEHVKLRIVFPTIKAQKLKADNGINFPDTKISISGITEKDKEDLPFIVENADTVNVSFVRSKKDVKELLAELEKLNVRKGLGIMLKIETQQGFEHLPQMMMTAMRHYPVGIMIARGDLAIECGWERMAEVQEEILWLCEAAHLPDVWATQVLENLAKTGLPSRAEITDAAMSQRADCVMLNKGPYIVEAIKLLDNIMKRMQAHQNRKFSMLRSLNISHILEEEVET